MRKHVYSTYKATVVEAAMYSYVWEYVAIHKDSGGLTHDNSDGVVAT